MAPGSLSYHIASLFIYITSHLLFCNLYFPIYTTKIPKIFILISLLDLTFASDREGIDNPFIALVARFLIVCAGTRWLACYLLLDWYLGSQKPREILTLLCCITLFLFKGKPTHAQEVARKISGTIAGEIYAQVKTYQVPITNSYPSHYIICHLPLIFLSLSSPLPFYSPSSIRFFLLATCVSILSAVCCHHVQNWGGYHWKG